MDLLVKLYDLETMLDSGNPEKTDLTVKKALITDKEAILNFIRENFPDAPGWPSECEYALFNNPVSCHIAVKDNALAGFSCYDATAKGFFGPMGVKKEYRRYGIGKRLLRQSLLSMKEAGYAYAVIGWAAEDAVPFYQKTVNAAVIEDSPPEKSIYRNMITL
jgi:ribosomal protein S18 acetylase RimI-like enzyme